MQGHVSPETNKCGLSSNKKKPAEAGPVSKMKRPEGNPRRVPGAYPAGRRGLQLLGPPLKYTVGSPTPQRRLGKAHEARAKTLAARKRKSPAEAGQSHQLPPRKALGRGTRQFYRLARSSSNGQIAAGGTCEIAYHGPPCVRLPGRCHCLPRRGGLRPEREGLLERPPAHERESWWRSLNLWPGPACEMARALVYGPSKVASWPGPERLEMWP
jgi:hypothetical protein